MQIHKYIYLIVALVPWEMRENSFVILFSPRLSFHFWIHSSLCWAQLASPPWVIHKLQKQYSIWACMLRKRYRPNVSTTLITAMGCQQCLPLSIVHLKGKHCQKPHCCNGVVDHLGLGSIYTFDLFFLVNLTGFLNVISVKSGIIILYNNHLVVDST